MTRRAALASVTALLIVASGLATDAGAAAVVRVGSYSFFKFPGPTCDGVPVGTGFQAFRADHCVLVEFLVDGGGATNKDADGIEDGTAPALDPVPEISVTFVDETGATVFTQDAEPPGGGGPADTWSFLIDPAEWEDTAPGNIRFTLASKTPAYTLQGQPAFQFSFNQLGTRTILSEPAYATTAGGAAAADLAVEGVVWEKYNKAAFIGSDPTDPAPNPDLVPADVTVTLTRKNGTSVTHNETADADGHFATTFTVAEIGDVSAGADDDFRTALRVRSTATYTDPETGEWGSAITDTERDAYAVFDSRPDRAQARASFVSERGWVEPGEEYIHAVEYRNASAAPAAGVTITDTLPSSVTFVSAAPAPDSVSGNTLTWNIGTVAAGADWPSGSSATNRILVTARAKTTAQDPQIVWKDASDTVTISQTGRSDASSTSHGPRITTLDTARYGDRPFPVVLVDYTDFTHSDAASAWTFYDRITSHENPASLWTHYQNMSFTQLHPRGELASLDATDTTFASGGPFKWSNPYLKGDTCTGASLVPPGAPTPPDTTPPSSVEFTPLGDRVVEGWYQLPGQRQYYGQDGGGTAIGNPLGDIDGGCGPTGKSAYDAASIADPDLDYNDFDSDRNCLVDFFEVVFQGRGGNGDSQAHGYDNIWPHSGNLQDSYIDADGQTGYVSTDQCRDRLERPLWWTDDSRSQLTTANKGDELKAHTRIGPYNVNPENGTTSVFAHEYGHSLGLPDYYSNNSDGRVTFDYWELMATDGFQYMSVFSRQDLGWIVPKRTPPSLTTTLQDSKIDTHRVDAVDATGSPYTLSGPGVHNGDAYYVELPHRVLFESVPSGKYAWYSSAGNGFGCPGRTLDVDLRNLRFAPEGSQPKLTFTSWWEIEWDFDYGFVLISTDGGASFTSLESEKDTTTPRTYNPNANVCQQQFGNGITGTSDSGTFPGNLTTRQNGDYPAPKFVDDSFDLSDCVGTGCILRFAYSTDTGVAKRGWVIDDIKVADDSKTYFSDDVETQELGSYAIGGWLRFPAGPSPFDHGYYVELRDRTSNDFDSAGQGERHPIDWIPGVSIIYTNEAHGYGNIGNEDPPAQTPLDPRRQPLDVSPRISDASFFPLPGLSRFADKGWVENYDENDLDWVFDFDCFTLNVNSLTGLGTGSANASISMTTKPSNCLKVLGISQGKPKPKPKAKLPTTEAEPLAATGGATALPIVAGIATLALAVRLRRRSLG